jgi:hypothetical protein
MNDDRFEEMINTIAEMNGTVSGRVKEGEDLFCIYKYEQEILDMFKGFVDFQYEVIEEFVDGNGEECIDIRNISS